MTKRIERSVSKGWETGTIGVRKKISGIYDYVTDKILKREKRTLGDLSHLLCEHLTFTYIHL